MFPLTYSHPDLVHHLPVIPELRTLWEVPEGLTSTNAAPTENDQKQESYNIYLKPTPIKESMIF